MKRICFLPCLLAFFSLTCCTNISDTTESPTITQDSSCSTYKYLFLNEFETSSLERSVVDNTFSVGETISYEDFLQTYVDINPSFSKHYSKLIEILYDDNLDITDIDEKVLSYINSVDDLSAKDNQRLQLCGAALCASLIYFSGDCSTDSRGIRSWLKKQKSRIVNASISAMCGAVIGAFSGAFVGASVPIIGYIPGAIVGGLIYGGYAAKEGYTRDAIFITSGSINVGS